MKAITIIVESSEDAQIILGALEDVEQDSDIGGFSVTISDTDSVNVKKVGDCPL